jgi:antitoxin component YwqK of YwqJK toxin-antitoxin module
MKTKPLITLLTTAVLLLFSINSFVYGETKAEYYESGKIRSETNFEDGKENGLMTVWYENGNKSLETNFKDGIPHGSWARWNEDGQKRGEGFWLNGEADGLESSWNDHGVKVEEINYKNGKFDGKWIEWSESGEKIYEANYKNDMKVGVHTSWFLNGDKKYEEHYSRGALVKHDDYVFNFVKSVVRGEEPWEAFAWRVLDYRGFYGIEADLDKPLVAHASLVPFSKTSLAFTDNFQDGFDATDRGDYRTAYKLWLPFAEQGNGSA